MLIKNKFHNKVTRLVGRKIKFIVIHYTAGTTSKSGAAYNTAAYFQRESDGSADYTVDDENVYLCNSDIKNQYCWSVGGNKYGYYPASGGAKYYGICTNANSISIEICSNKKNKASLGSYDTDWYFSESELKLAAELTRMLMKEYNIGIDNVIMHYNVNGKPCPNPWVISESRLSGWENFKAMVTGKIKEDDEMIVSKDVDMFGKIRKVEAIVKDGKTFINFDDFNKTAELAATHSKENILTLRMDGTPVDIMINGQKKRLDKVVNNGGSNMVYLREIVSECGGSVKYNSSTKSIEIDV